MKRWYALTAVTSDIMDLYSNGFCMQYQQFLKSHKFIFYPHSYRMRLEYEELSRGLRNML